MNAILTLPQTSLWLETKPSPTQPYVVAIQPFHLGDAFVAYIPSFTRRLKIPALAIRKKGK